MHLSVNLRATRTRSHVGPYRHDDGGIRGNLGRDIDVHVDLGRVVAKIADLRQRRAEAGRRRGDEPKDSPEKHNGLLAARIKAEWK